VSRAVDPGLEHDLQVGAMVGVAAAIPTIAVLCLAGAARGVGGFTPMYSVVSIVDTHPLAAAEAAVAKGQDVLFYQQPFMSGVATCLALGAIAGVGFAFGLRRHPIRQRGALLPLGVAHGLFAMCVFYLGVLFLLGQLMDSGLVASSLARVVGWPALIVAHALYGLGLGYWYYRQPFDLAPDRPWARS
jgi:hypothetical protein